MILNTALGAIGVFGVLGMTGLFPLIGSTVGPKRKTDGDSAWGGLDILIPAHNEERTITLTIESARRSLAALPEPGSESRIIVAADSCTDRTAELARLAGAEVIEVSHQSKWLNLQTLLLNARAEWIALVDAGAIWPENLIARVIETARDPRVIGIAPAYDPDGGMLEALNWRLERALKSLESRIAGGPISVHGATVFYRRSDLEATLKALSGRTWLNDDVVLPLMVRTNRPEGRIIYLPGESKKERVRDAGLDRAPERERHRRRRLAIGNLEWIKLLLPEVLGRSPQAGVVALRRVFRVFWLWFLLCAAAGCGLKALLLLVLGVALVGKVRGAAIASILAPWDLVRGPKNWKVTWN